MRITKLVLAAVMLALVVAPAAAQARDRDRDGLPDRWEKRNHLSTHAKSANKDPDRDRVDNLNEYRERTKARKRDSDRDGVRDGREDRDGDGLSNSAEDKTGNDPSDSDTDNDGVEDGDENAGTVASYEDGVLTIDLVGGGSVTGKVTDDTRLSCESESSAESAYRGHARSSRTGHCENGDSSSGDSNSCTIAVGDRVHEAELRVTSSDGNVWREVELLK
jgi:hypothetical protein